MITNFKIFEMKYWFRYGLDHTPEIGDYILIDTKDMTNPPDPPFGKITGKAVVSNFTLETHIKVETVDGENYIFKSDVIRFLTDEEIKELFFKRKQNQYNL